MQRQIRANYVPDTGLCKEVTSVLCRPAARGPERLER